LKPGKLFKPFTPHVIAWSVRKGFNQSIRRKEQKTRLQRLAWAMPKPVLPQELRKAQSSYEEQTQGSGSVGKNVATETLFQAAPF